MYNELITNRAWLEIDLDKLSRNIAEIRSHLKGGCDIIAVVKANGYGQGAAAMARYLGSHEGIRRFAVASFTEAVELREAGIVGDILILSSTETSLAARLIKHDLTQTVFSPDYAADLSRCALKAGGVIKVHVKLDTGMTRIGFDCRTEGDMAKAAAVYRLPGLRVLGSFSHFASADDSKDGAESYTLEQLERFSSVLERLEQLGCKTGLRHICNTGGMQKYPRAHFDLVRCGAAMSGYNTACDADNWRLEPISSLKAAVISLRDIPAGTAVSYGRNFCAARPTRVATLSIGYADGYPRALSGKGRVMLHGRWAPQIGNVCMDQMMVDVTDIPDICVGDAAVIIGRDGQLSQTADDLGEQSGSCMHEILSRLSPRLQRIYLKDGGIWEIG